ncbi:MAG: Xaa-Pro aminopeptidase [Candidatus Schmidhempelia sp.]|nr:Xaa-Pro aminopeptidase [Candidatus Schmidhempelia sp.]
MRLEIQLRRQSFTKQMLANSAAIFFAAPEAVRSNDTHYPYRQNSDFWYLTHFNEPEAALLLIKNAQQQITTILFNRKRDTKAEIWTGYRLGQQAALTEIQVDASYSFDEITTLLPKLLAGKKTLYYATQLYSYADEIIEKTMATLQQNNEETFYPPETIIDWQPILHTMRLIKSEKEITIMRQAGKISALGHKRAMQACQAGLYEYQLEAEILHEFAMHGARYPSYNTIVGGGNNACILHYDTNSDRLKDGSLVLIDAGCEYHYYAGDITRTFPVNGKFTQAQRDIYNIVLEAQYYAIKHLVIGSTFKAVNEQVIRIMLQGLKKLNIIQGELDQLIQDKAYLPFYMHGLGHWLGIDVHDVGCRERELEAGMVLTVEPGLYINKDANVPNQYRGIGVRIEDNILITATGNEVLTSDVPKDPDEIEYLMANKDI